MSPRTHSLSADVCVCVCIVRYGKRKVEGEGWMERRKQSKGVRGRYESLFHGWLCCYGNKMWAPYSQKKCSPSFLTSYHQSFHLFPYSHHFLPLSFYSSRSFLRRPVIYTRSPLSPSSLPTHSLTHSLFPLCPLSPAHSPHSFLLTSSLFPSLFFLPLSLSF